MGGLNEKDAFVGSVSIVSLNLTTTFCVIGTSGARFAGTTLTTKGAVQSISKFARLASVAPSQVSSCTWICTRTWTLFTQGTVHGNVFAPSGRLSACAPAMTIQGPPAPVVE